MKVKCRNILIFPICGLLSPIKVWVWDDRDQFLLSMAPSVTEWRQYFPCPNLVLITIDHDQVQETEQNKFKTNSNSFRIKHKSKKEFAFSRCVIKINREKKAFKNKNKKV